MTLLRIINIINSENKILTNGACCTGGSPEGPGIGSLLGLGSDECDG